MDIFNKYDTLRDYREDVVMNEFREFFSGFDENQIDKQDHFQQLVILLLFSILQLVWEIGKYQYKEK